MAETLVARFLINGVKNHDDSKTYTADGLCGLSFTIADLVTDQEVAFTLDISQIVFFYMVSDQDVTIEFNNSTTGVPTIALVANVPFIVRASAEQYNTSAFSTDITKFFVTNASGSTANIVVESLEDSTL